LHHMSRHVTAWIEIIATLLKILSLLVPLAL
jgi:hypothetical protein